MFSDSMHKMADLYQVELRELLNGERKNEPMNKELKETVMQVAEYSNAEKKRSTIIVRVYFVVGIIALIANAIINMLETEETFWIGFLKGGTFALALTAMVFGILYTTETMMKIQAFKMRLIGKETKS